MLKETVSTHRIWFHAAVAAVVMILGPTFAAAIGWISGSSRDPDMSGVFELIFFLTAMSLIPAAGVAFGVFAPAAIALDRILRGRTSRLTNALLGVTLGILSLAAVIIGNALLRAFLDSQSFVDGVMHPLPIWASHPERAVILIAIFAVPGAIAALGMRNRQYLGD